MRADALGLGRARPGLVVPACLVLASSWYFFTSPGTIDVGVDQQWIANADRYGFVNGFAANHDTYPPIIPILLTLGAHLGRHLGVSDFIALKASLLACLILTSLIVWLWTRSAPLALWMYLASVVNALALGYLDMFMAPAFVAALWALSVGRLTLFALLFTLSCFTKFQPLIIAPVLMIYLALEVRESRLKAINLVGALAAASLLVLLFAWFYRLPLAIALVRAFLHPQLSANALNLNWIVTYALHVAAPQTYGGLVDGRAALINPEGSLWMTLARILFWVTYEAGLVLWATRRQSFTNLIFFSLLAYLTYFTLNPGVHENHLFLAWVLGLLLYWRDGRYWPAAVALGVLANLNLVVFYGLDGRRGFDPVVAGIDVSVVFAAMTVLLFGALFVEALRLPSRREAHDRRRP